MNEFILCAAIHYDDERNYEGQPKNILTGIVVCGRRHSNCYSILAALKETIEAKKLVGRDGQGFITSFDRFVSRAEAFKIAKKNNQIFHKAHDGKEDGILISEDLY